VHRGDGAPVVRLRWVFTDQPFLPLGTQAVINNRVWNQDQASDLEVGQLPLVESDFVQDARWKLPAVALGAHQCHPEWFATGEPWPNSLPPTVYYGGWIPACCLEEAMCITDLCAKDPANGQPASQHTQYAVDATPTTPAAQFVVGEAAAGPGPFIPGVLFDGMPQGTAGLRQSVVMSEGVVKLVARRGAVEAAVGVLVDSLGVPQFVLDNVGVPISGLVGGPLPVSQGGTGVTTLLGFVAALGLGTAAFENVGTAGHTLPFLDGANTFSAPQWVATGTGSSYSLHAHKTTAINNASLSPIEIQGTCSVDTVAGYSVSLPIYGKTGSLDGVLFSATVATVVDATPATRKLRVRHYAGGTPDREYLCGESLAAGPGIGFLGATAIGPQAGDVGAALVAFGLMTGTPSFAGNSATATLAAAAVVLATPRDINGVTFDGSANITVRLPSADTTAESVSGGFDITGSSGTYQATGLTIALPAAGTYLVTGRIRGRLLSPDAGGHWIVAKLRDNTAAADVPNSETMVILSATEDLAIQATAGFTAVVTVGGASTLELYAARFGTAWTTSSIGSDANGRTVLDWVRLF
jgi:hypothetical protein